MIKPAVNTAQTVWELDQLLAVVTALDPDWILEVGVYEGGTLWHWLQMANVVAIDDTMRQPGPDEWHAWAHDAGTDLTLLQGNSHDMSVAAKASELGPYRFVFIDADHTYESVWADWENYSRMVTVGGAVAFHDIVPRRGYGVARLWSEIKSVPGTRWMEICQTVADSEETKHGIGVVWM